MATYHESELGFLWLQSVLIGDATLMALLPGGAATGVWRGMAPPDTLTPFIILVYQSGRDVVTATGAFRLMSDLLYQVKAVGPASISATIAQVAGRIDRLLGGPPVWTTSMGIVVNSVQEGQTLACYREQPLHLDELVNGELWTNVGGLYRVEVEQLAS